MSRSTVRAAAVIGLALLTPWWVPASGASADAPAPTASASAASRPQLDFFSGNRVEAGDSFGVGIRNMPAGWDEVTVTSPALAKPIHLTPEGKGSRDSALVPARGGYPVRADAAPGTYTLTATSHGRAVATAPLEVAPVNSLTVRRFGVLTHSTRMGDPVRPGSKVVVVLADEHFAESGGSRVVRSPAFEHDVTIRTDSPDDPGCKCDDGSTLYAGHINLRHDLRPGTYPLTVMAGHGHRPVTAEVTVAGEPVSHSGPWLIAGAAAGALALGTVGVLRQRARRRRTPA
ncbi:hypothetical protein ACT1U9_00745 [Streptomyces sp. BR1]|uniref:hypothetical protein n=1 Tax=Streptomyces sp. BR1 TaxID=1592323 RepID=UPI00402B2741